MSQTIAEVETIDDKRVQVVKKGNYTIERLAEDFRGWVEREYHDSFDLGDFSISLEETGLGLRLLASSSGIHGRNCHIGNIEIAATNVVEISLNEGDCYASRLPLKDYVPFQIKQVAL